MSFDEILDFLFHKTLGIIFSIASLFILMLTMSSCIPLDACAIFWGVCGCDDCAFACVDCSEDCDDIVYECFGGEYDEWDEGYVEGSSCVINECLFGRYGCERECGGTYTTCGGFNTTMCTDCESGCDDYDGYRRASCFNCTTYCDGTGDPDSPNFQEVYLYSITVVDGYGSSDTFKIYESTRSIGYTYLSGMNFVGYFAGENGSGTQYTNGETILILPPSGSTIYPYYTDIFAGINFGFSVSSKLETDDGGFETLRKQSLDFSMQSGDSFEYYLPTAPDIDGYVFRGWEIKKADPYNYGYNETITIYYDGQLKDNYKTFRPGTFGLEINSDLRRLEIYAIYEITRYNVTINFPDSMYRSPMTQTFKAGSTLADVSIQEEIDGYIFAGLSYSEGDTEFLPLDTKIESDMTLYASYKEPLRIYYDETEYGGREYYLNYYDGQTIELPTPEIIPLGLAYNGWYIKDDVASSYRPFKMFTMTAQDAGMILVPSYTEATYTATLYINNGETILDTVEYTASEGASLPEHSIPYSDFDGWYDSRGYKYTSIPAGTTYSIELYARYTPKSYTIWLNANGGTLPSSYTNKVSVTYGEHYYIAPPTKAGNTFTGWYCNSGTGFYQLTDANGYSIEPFGKINGTNQTADDLTIYDAFAKWDSNAYSYSFVVEGQVSESGTVSHNGTITAPTPPTKIGHTFDGWYYNGALYDFSAQVKNDITLTAEFTPITYTLTLMITQPGGHFYGDSSMTSYTVQYTYGQERISFPTPVNEGFIFLGWFNVNGSTMYTDPTGNIYPTLANYVVGFDASETIILYASWTLDNT